MLENFKTLADETRLRILAQLLKSEMCVCEIEECLGLTQSNASRHLTIMKKAGILHSYKTAQWTYYQISEKFILENKALYDYLVDKIGMMSFYQTDYDNYMTCKQKDLCSCKIKLK